MVAQAARGCVGFFAKGAFHVSSAVNARIQVLSKVILIHKTLVTRLAVIPVVAVVLHVTVGVMFTPELDIARLAWKGGGPVIKGIHMLRRCMAVGKSREQVSQSNRG